MGSWSLEVIREGFMRDAGLTSGTCGLEVGSFGGDSQWLKPPASTHDKCKV